MAGLLLVDISRHGSHQGGSRSYPQENPKDGFELYFSKKDIEENSPSRRDGITLKKECHLRKSYCIFLQEVGKRLDIPQITIATAIIFCHRFFLRQSHAKNDMKIIATASLFLASKVEESVRTLRDVIFTSNEVIYQKNPEAGQRIKQVDVYEQQKELILLGERVILATLGFDLNVEHPYKPLITAMKKFKVLEKSLAQVAWNFINDGLQTSLCLQFKPLQIAAGALYLAAIFLKVKLPTNGNKFWWQELDVVPRQLEEISNQMLELYEPNLPDHVKRTIEGGNWETSKAPTSKDETAPINSNSPTNSRPVKSKNAFQSHVANHLGHPESNHRSSEIKSEVEGDAKHNQFPEQEPPLHNKNYLEAQEMVRSRTSYEEEQDTVRRCDMKKDVESNSKYINKNLNNREGSFAQLPQKAIQRIDGVKVKVALERQRKATGHLTKEMEVRNADDLIERELEGGIEMASESEKNKQDRSQSWPRPMDKSSYQNMQREKNQDHAKEHLHRTKGLPSYAADLKVVEEGEVSTHDVVNIRPKSPKSGNQKRKERSSPHKIVEGKMRRTCCSRPPHHNHYGYMDN